MRILLDTNVLFSGLGFRGTPGELLETIVQQYHTVVTSHYILDELQAKIREKFKGAHKEAALDLLLYMLARIEIDVKQLEDYQSYINAAHGMVPDQDVPILALAMQDDVDCFVTGDTDFLDNDALDQLSEVKIRTPREMLDFLSDR